MQILFSPFMLSFSEQLVLDATLWESFRLPARMPFMTRRDVWNFAFKSWRIVEKKWNKLKFMLFVVQDFLCKKQKLKHRALQISENDRMTAQLFTYLTAPVVWILFLAPRHPIIKILDQLHYPANFLLNMEIRVKWPLLNGSFLKFSFWSFATSLARLFRNCWLKLEWMTTDKSRNATVCWKMCFLPLNQFKSALQSSSWSIWTSPSSKFYLWPMEFSQTVSSHCQTHLVGSPCHLQVTAIWMQSFSHRKQIWHHWHFGEWINQELQHSSSFPPNPKHSKLT